MTKNRQSINFLFAILFSAVLVSCGPLMQKPTVDRYNTNAGLIEASYIINNGERIPRYNALYFANGQGYEYKNYLSNKLIIALDSGPDWYGARVGIPGEKLEWNQVFNWLLPLYYNGYSLFMPEKFDWGGGRNRFLDIKDRERYTYDNLNANYAGVIKEYLSQNDYETIIILGHSEGGFLAPELYFLLEDYTISALISIGAGGLSSPADITAARYGSSLDDESFKNNIDTYNQFLATYSGERYAEAPDEVIPRRPGDYFLPLIYLYSQQARRPFELYKKINIPVLFIHGQFDGGVNVASTKYVEENLPDKHFDYIYYPTSRQYPRTVRQLETMRTDIANWLKEKGL